MGSFLATLNLAWFLDGNPRSAELVWQARHGSCPALLPRSPPAMVAKVPEECGVSDVTV